MSWDANSSLASVTPPGKPQHSLSYTPINQLNLYTSPNASGPFGPTSYTYNADRQVEAETRPDGTILTWNYDSAGRKDTLKTGATTLLDYDYYASPAPAGGAAGRVKTLKARSGATGVNLDFQYDGQLTTQVAWSGAAVGSTIGGTVGWTYNSDFLPVTETAKGSLIKFGYDLDGLPTCAAANALGCTAPSATDELRVTRDPQNGLVTGISLGNVSEEFVYNEFGELASHSAAYAGTPLMALTYDQGVDPYKRDALGRITRKYESFNGATVTVFDYVYDEVGQLTEVWKGNAPVARRERYTYDANGNRKSSSLTSTAQRVFTDDQDRIINYGGTAANTTSGGVIYNYTANGEVSSEVLGSQTWSFNYDLLGNLISTQAPGGPLIEYLVDGQNRRVAKKSGGTLVKQWLYRDSLSPVAELDGSGALISRFVYVTRRNIPDFVIRGTKTYRLLSDHLGSPRMAVNIADINDVPFRANYTAFGVPTMLNGTSADWIPFGFAGGLADPEPQTGLVRFGARDYEPASGRWMQRDPSGLRGGVNLYKYAGNDPVNFVDLTGREPTGAGGASGNGEGGGEGTGGVPRSPGSSLPGMPFDMPFGPTRGEHANRNKNNRCPRHPPTVCGGNTEDDFSYDSTFNKWRGAQGNECSYDSDGNLRSDPNQTFNFYPDPYTAGHGWSDFGAHFWYGGDKGYTPTLTSTY